MENNNNHNGNNKTYRDKQGDSCGCPKTHISPEKLKRDGARQCERCGCTMDTPEEKCCCQKGKK